MPPQKLLQKAEYIHGGMMLKKIEDPYIIELCELGPTLAPESQQFRFLSEILKQAVSSLLFVEHSNRDRVGK